MYEKDLGIGSILNPVVMLGDRTEIPLELTIAKIETSETEDGYLMKGKIVRPQQGGQPPTVNIVEQGWNKVR